MSSADVDGWYAVANADAIDSPALLFYPDRIEENLRRIAARTGGPQRVRLHIKTHKTAEIIALSQAAGFEKFKCATISEAELLARGNARDVLIGFTLVGPKVDRFARLVAAYPQARFSALVDDRQAMAQLAARLREVAGEVVARHPVEVLLDLDTGMHRSGIEPGEAAVRLYEQIAECPELAPGGLHVYDGHIRERDFSERCAHVAREFEPVDRLRAELGHRGLPCPRVVAGGTPTFPVHALRPDVECSPGTCVLWDESYTDKLPELDFLPAGLLLTRVISKPGQGRLCLDLGYKAVSPDHPDPRVRLLQIPDARMINHSEEHLAIATALADRFSVGDALYGVPWHVCPTVALHREAWIVRGGRAVERWTIAARDRMLSI
ncbi:MAG: D-TA family PLP-dependent enzyme [Pirellulales bacterium]|nr:D-TA family PLP-dependent enzyme [Pirellulales bacterium]